jgi:hypothetical protein
MATPYESARLILQLYEMRREPTMREARNFFLMFDPQSVDELLTAMGGPNSAWIRMVASYWDMAASLVVNGAIDAKMFNDANAEHVIVFGTVEPILAAFREKTGLPNAWKNLETVVMAIPDARNVVDARMRRIRSIRAERAAQAKA